MSQDGETAIIQDSCSETYENLSTHSLQNDSKLSPKLEDVKAGLDNPAFLIDANESELIKKDSSSSQKLGDANIHKTPNYNGEKSQPVTGKGKSTTDDITAAERHLDMEEEDDELEPEPADMLYALARGSIDMRGSVFKSHKLSKTKKGCILFSCFFMQICLGLLFSLGILYVELLETFHSNRSVTSLVQSLPLGLSYVLGEFYAVFLKKKKKKPRTYNSSKKKLFRTISNISLFITRESLCLTYYLFQLYLMKL